MPELPEVETIRRQLLVKLIGKKIKGRKIIGVRRRAKILIIDFDNGSSLLFHLKLTGQLIFNGKISLHTRRVFIFDDESKLIFNDARKFGWCKRVKGTKKIEKMFGPEAMEVSFNVFKSLLSNHPNSKIKTLLMDQKFIAGIGNIYSDEILFVSKINPLRRAKTIKSKEIQLLYKNVGKILKKAIKYRGSSVRYYFDACGQKGEYVKYHKVYQREGKKCFSCGEIIKRIKLAGRSAHFCQKCQK